MLQSWPFHPLGGRARKKLGKFGQIRLAFDQMADADHFEVSAILGVIALTARKLPLAVIVANNKSHRSFLAEDVTTNNGSDVRVVSQFEFRLTTLA